MFIYLALVLLCAIFSLVGLVGIGIARLRTFTPEPKESVTILKPLCGADPSLRENLETFFQQDGVETQILFGVERISDPAVEVVRSLLHAYPEVDAELVIADASLPSASGLNPKVRNLRAMLRHAKHDIAVISDSNVQVPSHYVAEMAHLLEEEDGLVTSLIVGRGQSLGAMVENLHLAGQIASGIAASNVAFRNAAVIGKSMMFRLSTLRNVGGLASVANTLAEDYVLGKRFEHAGLRVQVAPTPITNITEGQTLNGFYQRQKRWAMMRARLTPGIYFLEPLSMPLVLGMMAPFIGGNLALGLVIGAGVTMLREAIQWTLLRGTSQPRMQTLGEVLQALPLIALRDILVLAAWVMGPVRRHVSWRGNRVRVGRKTRLSIA